MSKTEYVFDGLDQWEKELSKIISSTYPKEFEEMVIRLAYELQGRVKEYTNDRAKQTGRLLNSWTVGNIKRHGTEYYIEVYTNVEYAEPVEYGHRTRGGKGFVPGKHLMELSLRDIEKALPGYLKSWLSDFISQHPL